jgi:hypothetical protein
MKIQPVQFSNNLKAKAGLYRRGTVEPVQFGTVCANRPAHNDF